jgi:DNA modification methylase
VFDPFMGSGTTAEVALENGRQYLGCELNPEYGALQQKRLTFLQHKLT